MGASSVTGSGPGSAEGKLRGLTLDNIHKILKPNENRSSVILKGNRIQFGGSGQTQIEQTIFLPPFVTRIDSKNGIVYFNSEEQNVFFLGRGNSGRGNSGQGNSGSFDSQIEVWKYTRKKSGSHIKSNSTILSSRLGKRYKPLLLLPMGSNSWVVPDRYIYPARPGGNPRYRNYFRFGVRTTDGERSDISTITIATATGPEYDNGSGIKILIMGQGGV